jgi:class 3 adenylate cyclase
MKCPQCQHENSQTARFCEECATPLARTCSNCRTALSATAKFCHACAHPAASGAGAPSRSPETYTPKHLAERILTSKTALEGERKLVTVLFADVKGSMELLADRDPEEARKLLDPVLERMMEAVHRYEGTVNQVMGDGIMALFGAPLAHEDHAVRACYAALEMQERVKKYAALVRTAQGAVVKVRIGLNSGEVVVRAIGSDLRMDYTAVGQTTHLASRMEQLADPGTIVITRDTLNLVEGYIAARSLGPVVVKGLAERLEVYEVTGLGPARSRLQAASQRGLTPFVGREVELEQLARAHRLAGEGHGQVVAVVGEAGVGKSRLVHEFIHSHAAPDWLVLDAASASYGKATSYLPVIDLLRTYFNISGDEPPSRTADHVTASILALDPALQPMVPALLALLDLPADDATWRALDPGQRRQRTLDAVKRLLLREARQQPVILIFQDLQWIDGDTQALLDTLVDSLIAARVLLLVNYRPDYRHGWGGKTCYSQVRLDPLPAHDTEALLDSLLGGGPELRPLKRLLVSRGGNPFFVEETIRALVDGQTLVGARGHYALAKSLETIQVPASVQTVLATRIDRLPPEDKQVLQVASAIGRDVPLVLLRTVTGLSEDVLRGTLQRLQAAELLCESEAGPDVGYSFKHTLTLDVTYGSLLRERRHRLDAQIVSALEELYRDPPPPQIERLAHHALRGELWDKALRYAGEAGARALDRSALAEVLMHNAHALEALAHVDAGPERNKLELKLLTQRAMALRGLRGYGAPELEAVYSSARSLYEKVGDAPELFALEWQQMQFFLVRADLESAGRLATRLLDYAEARRDDALRIDACLAAGMTAFAGGEFGAARVSFERGVALCGSAAQQPHLVTHGQYPEVFGLGYLAWTLWFQGWPDLAVQHVQRAVRLAKEKGHAFTYVSALLFAARVHQERRETARVEALAAQIVAHAREHGFAYYEAQGLVHEAWARIMLTGDDAAYGQLREGCAALEKTGTVLGLPGVLVHTVEACQRLGRFDEAAQILRDIAQGNRQSKTGFWDAEIARLNAELAAHGAIQEPAAARQWYRTALATARAQGAQALELRAALSYARAFRGSADPEARAALADVVAALNERADVLEFNAAQELLVAWPR